MFLLKNYTCNFSMSQMKKQDHHHVILFKISLLFLTSSQYATTFVICSLRLLILKVYLLVHRNLLSLGDGSITWKSKSSALWWKFIPPNNQVRKFQVSPLLSFVLSLKTLSLHGWQIYQHYFEHLFSWQLLLLFSFLFYMWINIQISCCVCVCVCFQICWC